MVAGKTGSKTLLSPQHFPSQTGPLLHHYYIRDSLRLSHFGAGQTGRQTPRYARWAAPYPPPPISSILCAFSYLLPPSLHVFSWRMPAWQQHAALPYLSLFSFCKTITPDGMGGIPYQQQQQEQGGRTGRQAGTSLFPTTCPASNMYT